MPCALVTVLQLDVARRVGRVSGMVGSLAVAAVVLALPLRGQTPAARVAAGPPAERPAAAAPGEESAEPATPWLPTTDPRLRVMFSFHREFEDCLGSCDRYTMWLRYAEPSSGHAPSPTWQVAAQTSCVDYWVDGRPEIACASFGQMAGRDRHGTDFVLLQMRASREQIDRMRRAGALMFQFGTQPFHLRADGRTALERFLAEAGGR